MLWGTNYQARGAGDPRLWERLGRVGAWPGKPAHHISEGRYDHYSNILNIPFESDVDFEHVVYAQYQGVVDLFAGLRGEALVVRDRLLAIHPVQAERDITTQARIDEVEEVIEGLNNILYTHDLRVISEELNFQLAGIRGSSGWGVGTGPRPSSPNGGL